MRFLELGLSDAVPDANTIWTFRKALTRATIDGKPAIETLFRAYEASLTQAGFLAMGGQIIDASIVAAWPWWLALCYLPALALVLLRRQSAMDRGAASEAAAGQRRSNPWEV